MKRDLEITILHSSTTLIILAILVCVAAVICDGIWGIEGIEPIFQVLGGIVVTLMVGCAFTGWILAIRFLRSRRGKVGSPIEYLLLFVVIFMPVAAIYVLRWARRIEAEEL